MYGLREPDAPTTLWEAEDRIRRAQIELRLVERLRVEYKRQYLKRREICLLPEMGRLTGRMQQLQVEVATVRRWYTAHGFVPVRS